MKRLLPLALVFMAAASQAQVLTTYDSGTGLGFGIVDNDVTDFTFTTSGLAGTLTEVQLYLNPAHTYIGDLGFDITSPTGEIVSLLWSPGNAVANSGGSNRTLVSMFFADTGVDSDILGSQSANGNVDSATTGTIYATTAAITTGAVPLADVTSLNGTWTLTAWDNAGGDTGTVDRIVFKALNPVPEPASMAVLGVGAAALLRRRKR